MTLTSVSINGKCLGAAGAQALAKTLENNMTLILLSINGSHLSADGGKVVSLRCIFRFPFCFRVVGGGPLHQVRLEKTVNGSSLKWFLAQFTGCDVREIFLPGGSFSFLLFVSLAQSITGGTVSQYSFGEHCGSLLSPPS